MVTVGLFLGHRAVLSASGFYRSSHCTRLLICICSISCYILNSSNKTSMAQSTWGKSIVKLLVWCRRTACHDGHRQKDIWCKYLQPFLEQSPSIAVPPLSTHLAKDDCRKEELEAAN